MKSFRGYISEEVLPTAQVSDGALDIEKPAVRAAINAALAGVVSQPAVTPYIVFNRISKLLAQYHIILPKKFLEGDKGVEVFELRQFGLKMGMTDSGEFVSEVPPTHYLFLQYGIISPMGITYAKPVVGGMFRVTARLVDKEELDRLLDMAEITMSEEAECRQMSAKAMAPKEPMHDITDDSKKVGNKKAVETSEKKSLDEEGFNAGQVLQDLRNADAKANPNGPAAYRKDTEDKSLEQAGREIGKSLDKRINEAMSRKQKNMAVLRLMGPDAGKKILDMGNRDRKEKNSFDSAKKEIDRLKKKNMEEEYEKVEAGVKKRPGETHTLHRRNPGHKTEYHTITTERKGHPKSVKSGDPKYIKKHWDKLEEASDKDRALSKLASDAVSKGHPVKKLPAGRAQYSVLPKPTVKGNIERGRWSGHGKFGIGEETLDEAKKKKILVTLKKDPRAKAGGGVMSIPKDQYDPKKHNLASEETIAEKLTKRMSAGDVISDFIHSKDPKFAGKSKKERQKMALGAYYGMHPEKSKLEEGLTPVKRSSRGRVFKRKTETVVRKGLNVKKDSDTILVKRKGDPEALKKSPKRISKDKFDPTKYNRVTE